MWGALTPLTLRVIKFSLHCTEGSTRFSFAFIKLYRTEKKKKHKFCLMTENIKLHRQPLPWNNCNSLHHALEQRPRTVSTLPATQEHYAACEWLNVHVCPTHRVSRYSVGLNVYYTIPMFMCADKTHKILNTFLYSSTSHDKLYSIFDFNIPNCCFLIFYVKEAVL